MSERPNIIFITSHDVGQHLGCYGRETVTTPALDQLAAEGVRFTQSFCVAPQCSPSRAAMYTGRYPHSNGVLGLTHGGFGWDLNPGERHLSELLRSAGYFTSVVGVQHESKTPARCGFDQINVGDKPGDEVAARCEDFLKSRAHNPQPFYLQVGFFEPHRKFDFGGAKPEDSRGVFIPPFLHDEPSARTELAAFQGAIRHLDAAVGRVLACLAETGLADNTLILFAADHGIPFPRAKCTLYDPGIQVALLVRWPRRLWSGGQVVNDLVSNVDYLPTILEVAGLESENAVQGRSFAALLDRRPYVSRTEIFGEMTYHQYYDPLRCIRTRDFKLICNFASNPSFMNPSQTYRPATITVVPRMPEHTQHPDIELFDLRADPNEFNNLAADPNYAAQRNELLLRLHEWMRQTNDPLLNGVPMSPQHTRVLTVLRNEHGATGATNGMTLSH